MKDDLADADLAGQTIEDQLGIVQTIINGIIGVLNAFAVVALLAASFGIVNTLLMSVQERTREIGLMKAMGMSNGRVFTLFSLEAVFIGLLGPVLSVALADTVLSALPGLQILLFTPGNVSRRRLPLCSASIPRRSTSARRASSSSRRVRSSRGRRSSSASTPAGSTPTPSSWRGGSARSGATRS